MELTLVAFCLLSHRQYGAIPVLVSQLRNPDTKVQVAILGALRNLSYGRSNDENKLEIAGEHGLPELILSLKMSRVPEVSVCGVFMYVQGVNSNYVGIKGLINSFVYYCMPYNISDIMSVSL